MPEIVDPEVALLARISTDLESQYADDAEMWAKARFSGSRPGRRVRLVLSESSSFGTGALRRALRFQGLLTVKRTWSSLDTALR